MNTLRKLKLNESLSSSSEIRNISELWEAAIAYYKAGDYDTDAMYQMYQRANPRITFQDIANVTSAVFADTYWVVIQMDSSILSKHMVQALSLSPAQADKYAQNAMKQWRGSLSRNNISDTGQIPAQGSYSQSIDIVCNQDTPLMPSQLIKNWNNEYWKQPSVGKNYIYIRVQNKDFVGSLLPKAQMFYTTGGFNQPPSSWVQCFTADGDKQEGAVLLSDNKPGPMPLGDRGASEAFYFEPKSTDHVCVIAAINDQFFKSNDPLGISNSNWNSTTWITHNGASAWHNVNPQTESVTKLKVFNQDGTNENFVLRAQCRNVPVGSTVRIQTADKHLESDGVEVNSISQLIETEMNLPGNYEGDLLVTLLGPDGELLPSHAAVEFSFLWKLQKGHDCYAKAAVALDESKSLANDQSIYAPLGSYTITGAE